MPSDSGNDARLVRLDQLEATITDIEEWWRKTSEESLQKAMEKARDYDGIDLEIMGKAMEALVPASSELDTEQRRRIGLEMACAFYLIGKAARMIGAYRRGSVPKDDHWDDADVYTMMARRIRATGQWT